MFESRKIAPGVYLEIGRFNARRKKLNKVYRNGLHCWTKYGVKHYSLVYGTLRITVKIDKKDKRIYDTRRNKPQEKTNQY